MEIKANTSFLMLKINTPSDIDFLAEHQTILDKSGEVWFCLNDIKEVKSDLVIWNFRTKASDAPLTGVFRSMCNSFYIRCTYKGKG